MTKQSIGVLSKEWQSGRTLNDYLKKMIRYFGKKESKYFFSFF